MVPPETDERFGKKELLRLGSWGSFAALALTLAVLSTRSDPGARRLALAFSTVTGSTAVGHPAPEKQLVIRELDPNFETRKLAETVRLLTADRDRLLVRVTALERNFEDATGSIGRADTRVQGNADPAASPLPPGSGFDTSIMGPTIAATIAAASISAPGIVTAPFPSSVAEEPSSDKSDSVGSESIATKTEFGIDIGGGVNIEAMRELWAIAKGSHGLSLDRLRPVIAVRDGSKRGSVELRLIAGPLANASAAARLCGTLAAAGWACRPAVFDGQRLAIH